ncbi:uncharacterized protein B0T15DRAFT_538931 [Chaetomium strumarium]|uniref:C2H2-type domain-containing protein n=1 Tax=Chaetomium strumarium TaxID=1170767 RepID=A0AAJ0GNM0_9PEZI|nr:hypothetical protein B0T15DRAFT_538931 [Chaetomium strumarium]
MTDSIAGHVARCLTLFRALLEPPDGDDLDFPDPGVVLQMMDERSRFKVWAGNIGAHRTGMSSLDYRLRDASHIKSQVLDLVRDLIQLIEDASAIAKGEETPWDQRDSGEDGYVGSDSDDEAPDTELGQIAADMADVINCLLRLTVTIRNPAPHDRYIQAKDTDASYFEPYDVQHVRSKFSEIEPWLEERLGKAISRRRQYLRYRQSHHQKLSRGLDQELDEGNGLEDETIASSIPSHLKEGRNTDTSVLRDDGSDAGMSQTSYATSMASSDRLTIPPLPKEAYAGPFECPLCHMIIEVRDRRAWKKHVYGDLQPYVCLENDCMTPEREYFRRHEWIEHVKQNHWKTYRCLLCQSKLSSFADCKSHLEASHPSKRSPGELDALVKLCEQALDISKGMPCPLCREDLNSIPQYQCHVGRHQEQLSLFALPSLDTEGEVDGDEEDSGDHQDTDSILEDQADAHSRSQIVSPESGEHPTGGHEDASSVPDGYIVEVKRIYREREGMEEEELTGRRKTHLDGQLEVPEKVTIDAALRELKEAQERQIDWMKQATELLAGIKAAEHIWKEKDAMGEDGSAPYPPCLQLD